MEWISNLRVAAAVTTTALLSLGIHGCQPSPDSDDSPSGALAGQPRLPSEVLSLCTTNAQCDDRNPCTADTCVERVCRHDDVDNGLPCDDGDACTTNDTCTEGVCDGSAVSCDDGNPCTTDSCDAAGECVSTDVEDGTACDDGNACTTDTTCTGGICGDATP